MLSPCLVNLGEDTIFLVAGGRWINVSEIESIDFCGEETYGEYGGESVEIRIAMDETKESRYRWQGEDAKELQEFLESLTEDWRTS
jgi:hypothetical protein